MISSELKCVWSALGSLLSAETRDISQEYQTEAFKIEAIDLITFCLRDLHQTNTSDPTGESMDIRENVHEEEKNA